MGLSRRQRVAIPAEELRSVRALVITVLGAASEAKRILERLALV